MQAGKDYAKRTNDSMYQVLTLIRFGRFDEVLEVTQAARTRDARRASGTSRRATRTCARSRRTSRRSIWRACRRRPRPSKAEFRSHPREAAARHPRRHSRRRDRAHRAAICPAAIAAFERAVAARRCARVRRAGAAAVSRRGTGWAPRCSRPSAPADAERVYREDLKDHPHNGWSLLGLQQALKAQGKTADRRRRGSRSELVALGYVDPGLAVLIRELLEFLRAHRDPSCPSCIQGVFANCQVASEIECGLVSNRRQRGGMRYAKTVIALLIAATLGIAIGAQGRRGGTRHQAGRRMPAGHDGNASGTLPGAGVPAAEHPRLPAARRRWSPPSTRCRRRSSPPIDIHGHPPGSVRARASPASSPRWTS